MTLEIIVSEIFGLDAAVVKDELAFRQIPDWDSMSHMLLIVRLEEDFNVLLDGEEIANMTSVGTARQILRSRGVAV